MIATVTTPTKAPTTGEEPSHQIWTLAVLDALTSTDPETRRQAALLLDEPDTHRVADDEQQGTDGRRRQTGRTV